VPRAKVPVRKVKPLTKAQKDGIIITREPSKQYDPRATKYTPHFIQSMIERLDRWSKKPEAYFIKTFCSLPEVDLTEDAFQQLCEYNDDLQSMKERARERMLSNLLEAALRKKIDGSFLERIMPLVWRQYKEWCREKMQLGSESDANKTVQVHVFPGRLPEANYEIPLDVKKIEKKDG